VLIALSPERIPYTGKVSEFQEGIRIIHFRKASGFQDGIRIHFRMA